MKFKHKRAAIWIPALTIGALNFVGRVFQLHQTPQHAVVSSLAWIGGLALFTATCIWVAYPTRHWTTKRGDRKRAARAK